MRTKRAYNRRPPQPIPPQAQASILSDESVIQTAPVAPSPRPEMRPQMREEDPRARAARRAAELMGHIPDEAQVHDNFAAPEPPQDWSYEWKAIEVLGKEIDGKESKMAQTGWERVPADRHPEMMPKNYKGAEIKKDGMVLCERPKAITDMMRERESREARQAVRDNEAKLGAPPPGQFQRSKPDGDSLVKVKKSYAPIPIPQDG